MRIENAIASEVLERILSSYGFTMQKELGEKLGIAKSNVAGWLQRGQVPGNVIVQCALDTGADVNWLVTGEFDSSHLQINNVSLKGKALYDQILASGGKAVLRRIMDAYGFSTQKELGDLLGISTATISTWVRRNFFPGDVVIACALDTGVSLEWLATGKGGTGQPATSDVNDTPKLITLSRWSIASGELINIGGWTFEPYFISYFNNELRLVEKGGYSWLIDFSKKTLGNGLWLLDIDGSCDVYTVAVLPEKRINIAGKTLSFECDVDKVKPLGVVVMETKKMY